MRARAKFKVTVSAIVLLSAVLVAIDLYRSYASALGLAAQDATRFTDCSYTGTRLSFSQVSDPPELLRLPHWEVTYASPDPAHRFTRIVRLSGLRLGAIALAPVCVFALVRFIRRPNTYKALGSQ